MRYQPIDTQLFIKNRDKLLQKLPIDSIAIFHSNDIMPTNADGTFPFRQNNDLFYLSGIDQEESILVLAKTAEKQEVHLFLRETSELIAVWEGKKLSLEEGKRLSGIEQVHWTKEYDTMLPELIKTARYVYHNTNEHSRADTEVESRDERFTRALKKQYPEKEFEKSAFLLHNLRYIKEETEIAQIQHACNITKEAFYRVLRFTKPGILEYEIEAEITHEFLSRGSRGHAYQPIVASGANACVLHYIENDQVCKKDELILLDFGAEYANYNADLTRTIPVSGRYTARQKDVYNAVLRVQKFAISQLFKGNTFEAYNEAIKEAMTKELVDLGLFSMEGVRNQDPEKPLFRKYFMHGTSHSLGLDVHDVDNREIPFENHMVFTVEPGIYIREEGIGVRIENDIVVNDDKPRDLMSEIPREVEEIEDLMNL